MTSEGERAGWLHDLFAKADHARFGLARDPRVVRLSRSRVGRGLRRVPFAATVARGATRSPRHRLAPVAPFVLLAQQRTGSNLLRSELDLRYRRASVHGEVCNPGRRSPGDSTASILDETFRSDDPTVRSVGCTLFYDHLLPAEFGQIAARNGLRVVHLRRRNWLRSFVSRELASRDERWAQNRPDAEGNSQVAPVEVAVDELLAYFRRMRAQQLSVQPFLERVPTHDVWFADLRDDLDGTVAGVADFLDLGPATPDVAPQFFRQNPQPLPELVANWAQVEDALTGTIWSSFLPEPPTGPSAQTPDRG